MTSKTYLKINFEELKNLLTKLTAGSRSLSPSTLVQVIGLAFGSPGKIELRIILIKVTGMVFMARNGLKYSILLRGLIIGNLIFFL